MTNREKILSNVGDNLVADQLIDCVQAYRTKDELRSHNPHIEYKFNNAVYKTYEEAFAAMGKWLDKEAQPITEEDKTIVIQSNEVK